MSIVQLANIGFLQNYFKLNIYYQTYYNILQSNIYITKYTIYTNKYIYIIIVISTKRI